MSTGPGIDWLDGAACLAFAALTGYFLLRLGSRRPAVDHAFHTAMGLTMVIMFWPGGGAGQTWIALLGAAGLWSALVLAQARAPHPSTSDSRSPFSPARRISYYAASGLVMLVAFGSSHRRMHTAASWPLWPLFGVAFILYASWLAFADRRRRPLAERTCTALMAVGMAFTAFSI